MASLTYLGHASFQIKTDSKKIIYVDPFFGEYKLKADYVLITHEHFDHNDISKVKFSNNTRIIRAKDMHNNGKYYTLKNKDFSIVSVPAANKNHNIDECVGYIVRISGLCSYFAGDTSKLDSMSELKVYGIDYAFLPIDGKYNMGPEEAMEVAQLIDAKKVVLIHTNTDDGFAFDINQVNKFTLKNKKVMQPGDILRFKNA